MRLFHILRRSPEGAQRTRTRTRLLGHLQRDGIHLHEGRLVLPASSVQTGAAPFVATRLDLPGLQLQIDRIVGSIDNDPAHAIGTAKEMIGTTCKSTLTARGCRGAFEADVNRSILIQRVPIARPAVPSQRSDAHDIPPSRAGRYSSRAPLS